MPQNSVPESQTKGGENIMPTDAPEGNLVSRLRIPRALLSVESMQVIGLLIVIIVVSVLMQTKFPHFLTPINMEIMTVNFVAEAIIALGMTVVIITGGIDLSVAGIYPFAAIVVGLLLGMEIPIPLAILVTLAAAAFIGWLNAFMFNTFRVHPFIATLAMLLTLRGVNLVITDGATLHGFPDAFKWFGQGRIQIAGFVDIPVSLVIFGVLVLIFGIALKNHRFFQQAYFIGGNRRSARMSGIKVERYLYFVYMLSATLAGVAGIIAASRFAAASNSYGQNMELRVITSVVVGGASLSGGVGSILGTTLGVLLMAIVYNAFAMTGVSTYWQDVVIGVLLLGAVFLSETLKKRRTVQK